MIFQLPYLLDMEHQLYWHITAQEHAYSLNVTETILADLNWYTTAMRLVIILTDDAIKHMCVCPLFSVM